MDTEKNVLWRVNDGAVVVDSSTRARVSLRGADTRAFLHRMSTQHVKELHGGDGRLNALLTDKGRFVDLVLHLDRGDHDGVLLIGSRGRGDALTAWLDRYLFTEKVELTNLTTTGSAADVAGAGAAAVVDKLVAGAGALAPWAFVEKDGVVVARDFDRVTSEGARVPSFVVLTQANAVDAAVAAGAVVIDAAAADLLRVAAGVPGLPEVTDAFTPLDLGMHDAIHWAKGCYIGQEVIARLDTYQKQHKRLVLLSTARNHAPTTHAPTTSDGVLFSGGALVVGPDQKSAGVVTSVAGAHALAIAKLPEDGPVQVKAGDVVVDAVVREPPTAQSAHD